jgi:hypothetical protein
MKQQRLFDRDDIRRARKAVDRGEVAEPLSGMHLAVPYLPPGG